jgi:hypothetical protein
MLIPLFLIPTISINRWHVFLKVQGIIESAFVLLKINFTSIFLGLVLPSSTGYDAIRIYQIEMRNKQLKGKGGASVIMERLLGFLILSFLGLLGAVIAVFHNASILLVFFSGGITVILVILFLFLKSKKMFIVLSSFLGRIKRGKRIIGYVSAAYNATNIFPLKKVLMTSIPLIVGFQLSTVLCGWLVFKSFDIYIPFYYHLAFIPLIQIISILPVSISGFGIREGGFVYFYGLLGVDSNISFLVSLLYYAVLMLVPAFIGMIIYLIDGASYKQIENINNS